MSEIRTAALQVAKELTLVAIDKVIFEGPITPDNVGRQVGELYATIHNEVLKSAGIRS